MKLKFIIIAITMLSLFNGITTFAADSDIRFTKAYGKRYVYLRDVAKYYNMQCYVWKEKTVLWNRWHRLTFYHNKRNAEFDGVKVSLMFAPFNRGIQAYVSDKDFLLMLDPILRHYALNRHRMKLIMIDPGHGGKDIGGYGNRVKEKDLTLQLAKKLQTRLRRRGYMVLMTRSSNRTLSLKQRTELSKRLTPDIFISIHANIAGNKSVKGVETFCLAPTGTTSSNGGKASSKPEAGNKFDKNSAALAYEIQKGVLKRSQAADRGVKHSRFYVLKNASAPAILIEVGFLSNKTEARRLKTNAYQEKIIRGIENGIRNYHRKLIRK
ncbi:MAG: N-acetylmuramoyl-L-alanine amidase [Victivallaceae bacterium]|nr:N-acetylmuramoyl-L-alanine amidase [Victivallaceae bacterium]